MPGKSPSVSRSSHAERKQQQLLGPWHKLDKEFTKHSLQIHWPAAGRQGGMAPRQIPNNPDIKKGHLSSGIPMGRACQSCKEQFLSASYYQASLFKFVLRFSIFSVNFHFLPHGERASVSRENFSLLPKINVIYHLLC